MVNAILPVNSDYCFENQEVTISSSESDWDINNQAQVNENPTFKEKKVEEKDSEESDKTPNWKICGYNDDWKIDITWSGGHGSIHLGDDTSN